MSKKILLAGALVVMVVIIVGANIYQGRQSLQVPVKTVVVETKDIKTTVLTTGRSELAEEERIINYLTGQVTDLLVNPGDYVKKGQVLARLADTELQIRVDEAEAAVKAARANLDKALAGPAHEELTSARVLLERAKLNLELGEKKLERTYKLAEAGAVSLAELETVEKEVEIFRLEVEQAEAKFNALVDGPRQQDIKVLEAQLEQAILNAKNAREKLDSATILAPVDGTVLEVNIKTGQWLNPGTILFTLGEMSSLQVRAFVNESDSANLKPGQEVTITGRAFWGTTYRGEVVQVAPGAVTRQSSQGLETTVETVISLVETAPLLRPGYTVDLRITTAQRTGAPVLPYEAILEEDGQKYVFVVKDGYAHRSNVIIGLETELVVEIISGVSEGEQVILNPGDRVKDGIAVRVEGNKR